MGADALREAADRVEVARLELPVEQEIVVHAAGDDMEVEVEHRLPGGRPFACAMLIPGGSRVRRTASATRRQAAATAARDSSSTS